MQFRLNNANTHATHTYHYHARTPPCLAMYVALAAALPQTGSESHCLAVYTAFARRCATQTLSDVESVKGLVYSVASTAQKDPAMYMPPLHPSMPTFLPTFFCLMGVVLVATCVLPVPVYKRANVVEPDAAMSETMGNRQPPQLDYAHGAIVFAAFASPDTGSVGWADRVGRACFDRLMGSTRHDLGGWWG